MKKGGTTKTLTRVKKEIGVWAARQCVWEREKAVRTGEERSLQRRLLWEVRAEGVWPAGHTWSCGCPVC